MDLKSIAGIVDAKGVIGDPYLTVTDLVHDSRAVPPGSMFICIPGARSDGHDFAQLAIDAGATALLVEHELRIDTPMVVLDSTRSAMDRLAAPFFGDPSRALKMFGVTGTNGKTTTAFMMHSIFQSSGSAAGLIGTVETRIGDAIRDSVRTTPESVDLQRLLREMVDAGCSYCAMEVSSEGLAKGRVTGTWFEVAAFTNLTQDHLDFHGSMEDYFAAKRALFAEHFSARGLVNIDDAYGRRLVTDAPIPIVTFGIDGDDADIRAELIDLTARGSTFVTKGMGEPLAIEVTIPGLFNVSNALCAVTASRMLGIEDQIIAQGILDLDRVPGRFERVDEGQPFTVVVDYAHTPDSLASVLAAARKLTEGRVLVVFGCGGDRDKTKRAAMGRAAVDGSDVAIATSDNPRSEDPEQILSMIEEGMKQTGKPYSSMVDRKAAITDALQQAQPGDIVVIAGKGHETGQEIAGVKLPFDDRAVAREALRGL